MITFLCLKSCFSEQAGKVIRFPTYGVPCSTLPGPQSDSFLPLFVVVILKFEQV